MKAVKKPNQTVSKDDMLAWFDGKVETRRGHIRRTTAAHGNGKDQ